MAENDGRAPGIPVPGRRGRKYRNILCFLLAAITALSCGGCWGAVDIDERAFVLMIGVDRHEQGVRVTVQVAVNEAMAAEGGGGDQRAFVVAQQDDRTTGAALHHLQESISMPVYYGQLKVVVFGEELAGEQGITDPMTALTREPEIRGQVWVTVARGRAEDIVRAEIEGERLPAAYIERLLNTGKTYGHTPDSRLSVVAAQLASLDHQPLLPMLARKGETVEIENGAVFYRDRMVGELEHLELHDFSVLSGVETAGVYSVPSPSGEGEFTVLLRNVRRRVSVTGGIDKAKIAVKVWCEGEVVQDSGDRPGISRGLEQAAGSLIPLERAICEEVERHLLDLVRKVQERYGSDIFGFYRNAGRLKLEPGAWGKAFPNAEVSITVHVRMLGFGLGGV